VVAGRRAGLEWAADTVGIMSTPPGPSDPHDPSSSAHSAGAIAPPPGDPLVPADLGGWLRRVLDVVQRSLVPLLQIQLAAAVIGVLVSLIAGQPLGGAEPTANTLAQVGELMGRGLIAVLVTLVVSAFASASSMFIAVRNANGEAVDLGTALSFAATRVLPLIGWSMLAGVLIVLGTLAFVIPGIYLAVVLLSCLTGVVVIERAGIGRAFALVSQRFWPTFGRMALVAVAALVVVGAVSLLTASVGPGSIAATVVQAVLAVLVGMVGTGVAVVTYAELRFHDRARPGALTPTLAAQLTR
jgi:hypothetical protein